jgi:hypothetical protein
MKQLKSTKRLISDKIRDNSVLARYSNKEKAKELLDQNKSLQIQLEELKSIKRF